MALDKPVPMAPAGACRRPADVIRAAVVAGTLSGVPSTLHAVLRWDSPLGATRAAGTLLGRPSAVRGLVAHGLISLGWAAVLARMLPRRRPVLAGAVAGGLIAVVDLGVAGRRFPAIRALPVVPQVLDHLAFGALIGIVLDRRALRPSGARSGQGGAHTAPTVPAPEWAPTDGPIS